jgi:murein DD-endopeptidase MepM/ murein hydrolase activator NlpD
MQPLMMRNYFWSVSVLAVGAVVAFTQYQPQSAQAADLTLPAMRVSQTASMLKGQLGHLRTIDPLDIDIVPTIKPVPAGVPLSSAFGMRKHPILGVDKMHLGLDFPAPAGTPVLATATGRAETVYLFGDSSSYGNHIVLQHDEVYQTLYAHLSRIAVTAGQIVEEGDTIGYVGSTGRSTNDHLHYEVLEKGVRVDPQDFL